MTSSPLYGTHERTMSSVAFHYRLWTAQKVELRRAWHAIIAFGQHTRSNDVEGGMTSPHMDGKHDRTASGVTCHYRLWKAHTVQRRWVLLDIIAFGLHTRLDDVGRGMTSPSLDSTHGRERRAWHDITALGQHTRSATSGVA